jgi:hypothetical protein
VASATPSIACAPRRYRHGGDLRTRGIGDALLQHAAEQHFLAQAGFDDLPQPAQRNGPEQGRYGGRQFAQGGQATAEHGLEGDEGERHADEHPPQPRGAEARAQAAAAQEQQGGQDDHGRQLQQGLGDGLGGLSWPLRLQRGEAPTQHQHCEQQQVGEGAAEAFRG